MSIIRVCHNRENPYLQIHADVLEAYLKGDEGALLYYLSTYLDDPSFPRDPKLWKDLIAAKEAGNAE